MTDNMNAAAVTYREALEPSRFGDLAALAPLTPV